MLNKMDAREDDEDYQNEVDLKFADLGKRKPGHFTVRQYAKYKMAAGKTAKSILVSCGARLAKITKLRHSPEIAINIISEDENNQQVIQCRTRIYWGINKNMFLPALLVREVIWHS